MLYNEARVAAAQGLRPLWQAAIQVDAKPLPHAHLTRQKRESIINDEGGKPSSSEDWSLSDSSSSSNTQFNTWWTVGTLGEANP